jgi:putative oxidoreductase
VIRSVALLASRLVIGGYMAAHGAQKLFGMFGGRGLKETARFFEAKGLTPGETMAAIAGASELGGGLLTATGLAYPLGPLVIAETMAVAATTHKANGAFSAKGGFELPVTNLAAALALAVAGPGKLTLGPKLPKSIWVPVIALGGLVGALAATKVLTYKPKSIETDHSAPVGSQASDTAGEDRPEKASSTQATEEKLDADEVRESA